MSKNKKKILQATVFALPFSLKLNQKLRANFITDYLTLYPEFAKTIAVGNPIYPKPITQQVLLII